MTREYAVPKTRESAPGRFPPVRETISCCAKARKLLGGDDRAVHLTVVRALTPFTAERQDGLKAILTDGTLVAVCFGWNPRSLPNVGENSA